jgi:hypothetical protein
LNSLLGKRLGSPSSWTADRIGIGQDRSLLSAKVQLLTKKRALALVVAVAVALIASLVATDRIGTLRLGSITAACLLLPGLGWAWRSHLRDTGDRLALAIGISICAVTVIGTTMAVAGRWSAPAGAVALLAVAAAGFLPHRLLMAIPAGLLVALKWFINLFAGPAYPAIQVSDHDPATDAEGR